MERTLISELSSLVGQNVLLKGWIAARRDHGKLIFFDLRDRSGLAQIVVIPKSAGYAIAQDIRAEFVVQITGTVNARPENMVNPDIASGKVEVLADDIVIVNSAKTPPFDLGDTSSVSEDVRLKYRYLDLRSERMARNLRLRHQTVQFMRAYLSDHDFTEVETPILTKSTPEGARDFVVPSRLQRGKFYALPQSPQQYKQLLMVAGLERYYQIARCFRDEDPRSDRAYGEFTQLDLEMSFVTQEDVLQLTEDLFTKLVAAVFPDKHIAETPWPRLTHAVAKAKYGNDKPDLRQDNQDPNELAFAWVIDFPLFTEQSSEDFFHGSGQAKFAPSHHMFTAPHPDDIPLLDSDPTKVRGLQHDLVLNGYEVGGGSIRIHQRDIQEKVFDLIGFSVEQKESFSHLLEAFTYGVPPHGGIAPGLDRFLMTVLGEKSIREVMAFPTTASGTTAVLEAPSHLTAGQLAELTLTIKAEKITTK